MSDLVEVVRSAAKLGMATEEILNKAADEIESLQAQIAEYDKELDIAIGHLGALNFKKYGAALDRLARIRQMGEK